MLHFNITPHSGVPVYRQLMDQIKYYVASKTLKAGDKLPSIRVLAKALAVNPTTIVKAYSELEHADVIEMRHGKGAFVSSNVQRISEEQCAEGLHRIARQLVVEAAQMGINHETVIQIIKDELNSLER